MSTKGGPFFAANSASLATRCSKALSSGLSALMGTGSQVWKNRGNGACAILQLGLKFRFKLNLQVFAVSASFLVIRTQVQNKEISSKFDSKFKWRNKLKFESRSSIKDDLALDLCVLSSQDYEVKLNFMIRLKNSNPNSVSDAHSHCQYDSHWTWLWSIYDGDQKSLSLNDDRLNTVLTLGVDFTLRFRFRFRSNTRFRLGPSSARFRRYLKVCLL